ncbi:rapid alkalinization factor-like [Argentina anserina]|uniref:rapid alkalinization factor-like n=1 Tax=Argentina anserina TaxID=57926 RepID=UPI0021765126|nr:rapid alkalinization factor-like [Potentilla anserina]
MATLSSSSLLLFFFIFLCSIPAAHSSAVDFTWGISGGKLIGDLDEELELQMDSEISRRILATSKYISYGALRRNSVPCSRRGASYYNCRPGAQANPYSRGCSRITRCRH